MFHVAKYSKCNVANMTTCVTDMRFANVNILSKTCGKCFIITGYSVGWNCIDLARKH